MCFEAREGAKRHQETKIEEIKQEVEVVKIGPSGLPNRTILISHNR
jgi:hypothetical protein